MPLPLPPQPTDEQTKKFAAQVYGWILVFVLVLTIGAQLLMR